MGFVTVKDFAEALEVKGGTVRQCIVRSRIIKNENGLIDTNHVTNYSYVLKINGGDLSVFDKYYVTPISKTNVKRKTVPASKMIKNSIIDKKTVIVSKKTDGKSEKVALEKPSGSKCSVNIAHGLETEKKPPEPVVEKPTKLTTSERNEIKESARQRRELLDYDLRQRKANAEYKERESELKQMQLEKIAGNTLPLDLTKKILKINCQAILVQFLSSVENMVAVTVEELGGVRADNVRITNELKKIFKKTVENCEKNADRDIENAVAEYSEIRARGERK